MNDFSRYYDLENYLFGEVSNRYQRDKQLSAFEFFCIVIWKANRAKSMVARRLLAQGHGDLESAVNALTTSIAKAQDDRGRLKILIVDWGFRLPMASAILTVLFPDDFTIYDVRVCEVLGDFKDAQYKTTFEALWQRYSAYVVRVRESALGGRSLRAQDRYLWGQSFASQLQKDIGDQFGNAQDDSEIKA